MNSDKVFYTIVGAVTLLIFGGILLFASRPAQNPTQQTINIEPQELIGDEPHTNLSPDEAQIVLVEFSDFQCPACKSYYPQVKQIKEDFGDTVSFIYRHLPLTSIHNYALNAAIASEAAGRQGKFYEYHDILFREQSDSQNPLVEEDFISYAEELNLNVDQFREDYKSNEVRQLVLDDLKYANSIGLNSTPTFFIGGERFEGGNIYQEIKQRVGGLQAVQDEDTQQNDESQDPVESQE